MPSRVPLRPGGPKSPNLSLPSHRSLSLSTFIYLGTCICLPLVDLTIALDHGETEDRHTTHNGPSLTCHITTPSLAFVVPRSLCRCAFALPLRWSCRHLTCSAERPNAVCYLSKGKWPCLEGCFENRLLTLCNLLALLLASSLSAQNRALQKGIRTWRFMLRRYCRYNIRCVLSLLFSLYQVTLLIACRVSERKPGHPDKLFQYCSTDINALVQRQIRVRGSRSLILDVRSSPSQILRSSTESVIFALHRTSAEVQPSHGRTTCLTMMMTTVMPTTRRFCNICVMTALRGRVTPRATKSPD
jgi:hypothetical protein